MMQIAVVGTGYVGLVTGVCLSEIGHDVTCVDIDEQKVERMRQGLSPIYEPGLDELMKANIDRGRLHFTTNHKEAFAGAKAIYIAVGTPQREDGQADLRFVEQVAIDIANNIESDVVVVTKSTVPVGTNERVQSIVREHLKENYTVHSVSNPEFLREGSAVKDTFEGDRIVIGANSDEAAAVLEEINRPFGIEIFKTDIRSAEMIKYASNAFLATKISFINEIANLCEKLEADVEDVAAGMGMDDRIGSKFLKAGIGYGGSCFPKDTSALVQIASYVQHDFNLLKSVIQVNGEQQRMLVTKAKERFGSLQGKRVAMLGLAFKPNTDDMREAASIALAHELVKEGATVVGYDPIAADNAKKLLPEQTIYVDSPDEAIQNADFAMIVTEWEQVKALTFQDYIEKMNEPIIFDGRNCYSLEQAAKHPVEYYSVGRKNIKNRD
ncbi:UDP-glucose/GDP-mannose dehydrogenase family protein [Bacillus sp. FJAT-42376]|uniref:UDP-glucose dehydrogenase family protein n=1 Tax=Bacillus sp. FJAT-42376 TaxID=2014076 RepID=UPI000F507037|nr:UDP-glucose/GDP-mannose dehydrogenase family protein [Bacillus sp. FJAT-42376]AZB44995.1 UDP-glucose/GDP-mannose dehydrogenase family protein [Bacillus sp. FJAT-42376]